MPTKIALNSKGQISGLLFESPQAQVISLEEATTKFKALPGKVSFLVQEGKTIQAALNTKTPLAVGSAFKLAVLKALKSEIASEKRIWKDVVQLQPSWKMSLTYRNRRKRFSLRFNLIAALYNYELHLSQTEFA
ncbi:MAG: hypothetical protein V7K40_27475 [Nostoc sp.]|uniref:hypothetical protein n=1 Tax=Nostoc sp. TaxID=1180 RepID=UPI002FF7F8A7